MLPYLFNIISAPDYLNTVYSRCFMAFFIAVSPELPCAFITGLEIPKSGAPPYSEKLKRRVSESKLFLITRPDALVSGLLSNIAFRVSSIYEHRPSVYFKTTFPENPSVTRTSQTLYGSIRLSTFPIKFKESFSSSLQYVY